MTLIVLGMVAAIAVILLAGLLTRHTPRRMNRLASPADGGYMPWSDGGGGGSDCDAGGSDGGCGDGGGGGGD